MKNSAAFTADNTILGNLVAYSPNPELDTKSTGSRSRSRSSPEDVSSKPVPNKSNSRIEKRRANTLAARRYRQKRLDQVAELESALKETQLERDALKVQLARLQGETELLRDLVRNRGTP
jgi:Basic region leucine zipper